MHLNEEADGSASKWPHMRMFIRNGEDRVQKQHLARGGTTDGMWVGCGLVITKHGLTGGV